MADIPDPATTNWVPIWNPLTQGPVGNDGPPGPQGPQGIPGNAVPHHVTHEPGGSDPLSNAAWTNLNNTFTGDKQSFDANFPYFLFNHQAETTNRKKTRFEGFGDFYISHVNDADNAYLKRFAFSRTGDLYVPNSYYESGRTTAMGYWQNVPFSAANFAGSGGLTWTVAAGEVVTNRYTLIGKTLHWICIIYSSTLSGSPASNLVVTLPGGFSAPYQSCAVGRFYNIGSVAIDMSGIGTTFLLYRMDLANLVADDNFYVFINLTCEIS